MKVHYAHFKTVTRCGIVAQPAYPMVGREVWNCLPKVAQCGNCDRLNRWHASATPEHIAAVETALHGIARAWKEAP